ncbi:MAG TPA: hypothetical protein VM598_12205 [Bdellovibrionota bacterium]|nr:hypothetical protein [Bdellovibrionota bacterium]
MLKLSLLGLVATILAAQPASAFECLLSQGSVEPREETRFQLGPECTFNTRYSGCKLLEADWNGMRGILGLTVSIFGGGHMQIFEADTDGGGTAGGYRELSYSGIFNRTLFRLQCFEGETPARFLEGGHFSRVVRMGFPAE